MTYLSGGEDGAGQEAVHVLQELALGSRGIAHDAHVDVPAQLDSLRRLLVHPAQEHQQDTALHLAWRRGVKMQQ